MTLPLASVSDLSVKLLPADTWNNCMVETTESRSMEMPVPPLLPSIVN